jgi:hypothetical protein
MNEYPECSTASPGLSLSSFLVIDATIAAE